MTIAQVYNSDIGLDQLTLADLQEAIRERGWQWVERIYNDWMAREFRECSIELTQDKSPHALSERPRPGDTIGWGRFTQRQCWCAAYRWIVRGER